MIWLILFPIALAAWVILNLAGWGLARWLSTRKNESFHPPEPWSWGIFLGPWFYYDHCYDRLVQR
jgi:hypothetical protein